MNNKTKRIVAWAFIVNTSFFTITSVNSGAIINKSNNHQQDDIEQLKELIISRLNLIHELSSKGTENKIIISELTTLRLLQDAYIQVVVDTNSRKNNSFSSPIKRAVNPSFSNIRNDEWLVEVEKQGQLQKEEQVSLNYLKQYIKGLKTLDINLTKSEYKAFKAIKTKKEFLRFHKSMLYKHKKSLTPQKPLKSNNKKADNSSKSTCSVF